MKKFLPFLLTLTMLFMLVPTGLAESSDVVTIDVFMAVNKPVNEAIELTRQYIEDAIGVNVNIIQGDTANFGQQLALYISGGDMPDVVLCSYSDWMAYAMDGAWADLTEYYDSAEYASLADYVGDSRTYVELDGTVYGVPSMRNVKTSRVTYIRQDWLDKLNLKLPTTLDEYVEVMRAFATQDPDGNGQNDTYGFSGTGLDALSALFGAFGATTSRDFFLNEDGTITTNAISKELKEALIFVNGLYAEGLIDPEIFTNNSTAIYERMGRAQVGFASLNWANGGNAYRMNGLGELQPDCILVPVMPPVGETGLSGNLPDAPFNDVVGISYKCTPEKVEAAMKFLNFQTTPKGFRTVLYGLEGEFYEWDEATNTTTWTYESGAKSKSGKYEVTDMELYKLLKQERVQAQSFAFAEDIGGKVLHAGSEMRFTQPVREDVFCMFMPDEYVEYNADLNSYVTSNILDFIMGKKSLETDWDAYVQGYLSMGGEEDRQARLEMYNKAFDAHATFAE